MAGIPEAREDFLCTRAGLTSATANRHLAGEEHLGLAHRDVRLACQAGCRRERGGAVAHVRS